MTTPTVPPLFAALVDDAGLFPPARLPMPAALARHHADAAAAHPVLTHRFLCPASRIAELRHHLGADATLRLGLIADTGFAGLPVALHDVRADDRLGLETVEVALPATDDARQVRHHVASLADLGTPAFVELPRAHGWRDALDVVAADGHAAKIRCGGVRADLFPTAAELAAFVRGVVAAGVPCKATAGLHHAVRYRDPVTGFDHHGFVNLLLAVCRAVERPDGPSSRIEDVLVLDDPAAVAAAARDVAPATAAAARRTLIAYGSCSTSEPIEDLHALDLLGGHAP